LQLVKTTKRFQIISLEVKGVNGLARGKGVMGVEGGGCPQRGGCKNFIQIISYIKMCLLLPRCCGRHFVLKWSHLYCNCRKIKIKIISRPGHCRHCVFVCAPKHGQNNICFGQHISLYIYTYIDLCARRYKHLQWSLINCIEAFWKILCSTHFIF